MIHSFLAVKNKTRIEGSAASRRVHTLAYLHVVWAASCDCEALLMDWTKYRSLSKDRRSSVRKG
jgi:hypothetical protein